MRQTDVPLWGSALRAEYSHDGHANPETGDNGTGRRDDAGLAQATTLMGAVKDAMRKIKSMVQEELVAEAKNLGASLELLLDVHKTGKLPVVNFAAGGVATPADAALMMQLGAFPPPPPRG